MPEFYLMRETPDNSGAYEDVADAAAFDTADAAVAEAARRYGDGGGRYAIRVYDSLRTDEQRAADLAATQAADAQRRAAAQPAPAPTVASATPTKANA